MYLSATEPHSWPLNLNSALIQDIKVVPSRDLTDFISYDALTQTIRFNGSPSDAQKLAGRTFSIKIEILRTNGHTESNDNAFILKFPAA